MKATFIALLLGLFGVTTVLHAEESADTSGAPSKTEQTTTKHTKTRHGKKGHHMTKETTEKKTETTAPSTAPENTPAPAAGEAKPE